MDIMVIVGFVGVVAVPTLTALLIDAHLDLRAARHNLSVADVTIANRDAAIEAALDEEEYLTHLLAISQDECSSYRESYENARTQIVRLKSDLLDTQERLHYTQDRLAFYYDVAVRASDALSEYTDVDAILPDGSAF